MIVNKYTIHSIFSLPQIFFKTFNKYDLKDNKFINMYINDVNNPLLSNHIFLVFKELKPYLLERFKQHPQYHNNYLVTIDKITYQVVSFLQNYKIHSIVNKINLGLYERLAYTNKIQILMFWNLNADTKVHEWLFNPLAKINKPIKENITIQDTKSPNS